MVSSRTDGTGRSIGWKAGVWRKDRTSCVSPVDSCLPLSRTPQINPLTHTRGTNAQAIGECVAVCVVFLLHFGQWDLALLLFSSLLLYGPSSILFTPPTHAYMHTRTHHTILVPILSLLYPYHRTTRLNRLRHQPLTHIRIPYNTGFVTIRITLWRRKFREMSNKKDNEIHERATDTLVNFETVKVRSSLGVCYVWRGRCVCEKRGRRMHMPFSHIHHTSTIHNHTGVHQREVREATVSRCGARLPGVLHHHAGVAVAFERHTAAHRAGLHRGRAHFDGATGAFGGVGLTIDGVVGPFICVRSRTLHTFFTHDSKPRQVAHGSMSMDDCPHPPTTHTPSLIPSFPHRHTHKTNRSQMARCRSGTSWR